MSSKSPHILSIYIAMSVNHHLDACISHACICVHFCRGGRGLEGGVYTSEHTSFSYCPIILKTISNLVCAALRRPLDGKFCTSKTYFCLKSNFRFLDNFPFDFLIIVYFFLFF